MYTKGSNEEEIGIGSEGDEVLEVTGNNLKDLEVEEMMKKEHVLCTQEFEERLKDARVMEIYKKAIEVNKDLFKGKVVLVLQSGLGLLAMMSAVAGAGRVLTVESGECADYVKKIVEENKLDHKITVIEGNVEDIALPEGVKEVDIIVSMWMGYCLFDGAMLDSVITARDRWLSAGGLLFPDRAVLYVVGIEFWDEKDENFQGYDIFT